MNRLRSMALVCLLAALPSGAWAAAARDQGPQRPALWRTYAMIVDLDNLPRTYTCDELWYVFYDMLARLGAPYATLNVLPYRCSRTPTGDLRSPRVQVHFQMPRVLRGKAVKWATLRAVHRRIVIGPGRPKRLTAADCELLRQIRGTLLDALPVKIIHGRLNCAAGGHFGLTLQLWVAAPSTPQAPGG
jgi:hypothetical protein